MHKVVSLHSEICASCKIRKRGPNGTPIFCKRSSPKYGNSIIPTRSASNKFAYFQISEQKQIVYNLRIKYIRYQSNQNQTGISRQNSNVCTSYPRLRRNKRINGGSSPKNLVNFRTRFGLVRFGGSGSFVFADIVLLYRFCERPA